MFRLGQLIVNKENQKKALFMGINLEKGQVHLLVKHKRKIPFIDEKGSFKYRNDCQLNEMIIPESDLERFQEFLNDRGQIDPGIFSMKTALFTKDYGFLSFSKADEEAKINIIKLAFETL